MTDENIKHEAVAVYLATAYKTGEKQCEVSVGTAKYKVLKREKVTAFYDEQGNSIFSIAEEVLAEEYKKMSEVLAEPDSDIGKTIDGIEKEAFEGAMEEQDAPVPEGADVQEDGETDTVSAENDIAKEDAEDEIAEMDGGTEEEKDGKAAGEAEKPQPEKDNGADNGAVYLGIEGAVAKLQRMLEDGKKNKDFTEPVVEYLIKRCRESESLAADVCQNHKTWDRCYQYIFDKAKKKLGNVSGPVRSDTVFEWAEDYFHSDDKAEAEKKKKESAKTALTDNKKNTAKKPAGKKEKVAAKETKAVSVPAKKEETISSGTEKKEEKTAEQPKQEKSKKGNKDMDGQMDFFSLMGM